MFYFRSKRIIGLCTSSYLFYGYHMHCHESAWDKDCFYLAEIFMVELHFECLCLDGYWEGIISDLMGAHCYWTMGCWFYLHSLWGVRKFAQRVVQIVNFYLRLQRHTYDDLTQRGAIGHTFFLMFLVRIRFWSHFLTTDVFLFTLLFHSDVLHVFFSLILFLLSCSSLHEPFLMSILYLLSIVN